MKTIFTLIISAILMMSATLVNFGDPKEDKLIGVWKWSKVINKTTGEESGIDAILMGMASEVKMEFKADHTYIESKLRKGSTTYSNYQGQWKFENDETLSTYQKEKWTSNKIEKFTADSLLMQMNPQMSILMIKEKIN
ncbi:MAG: hypothetical protein ACOVOO_08400 [Flavobacteriales bacterium]|jgi:hypothetical protein